MEDEKKIQVQVENRERAFEKWVEIKSLKFGIFASLAVRFFHSKMYGKAKWHSFLRWQKRIERLGVEVKRPWLYGGKVTFKMHNDKNFRICRWDQYDICNFLLVKLTVSGLYFATHGVCLLNKIQMRECWQARKMLIEAMTYEEKFSWLCDKKIREHFGVDWDFSDSLKMFNKEYYLEGKDIKECEVAKGSFEICADPEKVEKLLIKSLGEPLEKNRDWREKVLLLAKEIGDYNHELSYGKDKDNSVNFALEKKLKLMKEAFVYISQKQDGWWD